MTIDPKNILPEQENSEFYNVVQFFMDGSYEYTRRHVDAAESVKAAYHYATSVGARIGTTVRVIITDDGDCIRWEWKKGEGVTFPPSAVGQLKHI